MNLMAEILIQVIIAFVAGSLLLGLHRKIMARVQKRPGPPIVQHLLHSLKFFFKETAFPKTVSKIFYIGIVFILALIWIVGVIVGPVAHNSLLILFGVYAVYKIVEHNSGSSSGSPYGKLSCVRAVLSAATELPLFAAIVFVYLVTGSMNIGEIIAYQSAHGPLVFTIPLAALMFFMLIITKSPYSPFAITKDKALVSGFETEHFGFLRGFMLFSESIAWYVLLWVFLTIFFGPLNAVGYLVGMILITFITAFINATTPILSPNHSVMTQITIGAICFFGTIIMMFGGVIL
ncbi:MULTISPECIES: NADH-quinone oxidoreductase subunit H [Methanobrevibacter]|mgnify:FL=1|uniref:respiratory chain complex I subunit 1 family protein n=1 Tax=Methanobrevibacter TaxID=2172 RepID=UPI0015C14432|nr:MULTISPECIES: NADH-quinone oxidoreductase subunit H [Methanobrevibacter]MBS7257979.1 NADH-quinone oxidoreductase subunit H [Methanobrevibacter sp.]MCI7428688.1 NADH-quinone oxidoreductase subunit H [Methanobrevibacter sp.]MDD6777370.1 NADH-quinone oxidoreductase subunit H [Methanobacteriaceae archaeon]MDY3096975.1 NADH-quinone oxidoreductase subunit H [Methanobrevibacter sp.]